MDYKALLVTLLEIFTGFRTHSCVVQRGDYCECDDRRRMIKCSRLRDSVDNILPGLILDTTRELILTRMWVDDAVELNPRNFANLKHLTKIDFSFNRISEIHAGTFSHMKHLREVNLSNNRLKLLDPDAFTGRPLKLEKLDLSYNRILVLTDHNLKSTTNLKVLDLRHNPILFISGQAFIGLSQLERLYLSSANFTKFPAEPLSALYNLTVLELRHMPHLRSIPSHAFSFNDQLENLTLENFPLIAGGLAAGAFAGLSNLRRLTITSCNLTAVPCSSMTDLGSLEFLDLSGNSLQVIYPDDFAGLESLQQIVLERTALEEIKAGSFTKLHNLISLDLSNNRLKTVYEESFPENLFALKTVMMTNNAWSCDCSLKWLANSSIDLGTEPVTCADPFAARGNSLIQMRYAPLPDTFYGCSKPTVKADFNQVVGTEGGDVTLPCDAEGVSPLTFMWLNAVSGKVMRHQGPKGSRRSLTIRDLQRDHGGEYTCLVRNAGGEVTSRVKLVVEPRKEGENMIDPSSTDQAARGHRNGDCSTDTASIPSASSKNPSRRMPTDELGRGSTTTTAILIGILTFATALGVVGVFVFVGCIWNKRRDREIAGPKVVTLQVNGNGTCHRGGKHPRREPVRHGRVVLGGQGIYSRPPQDLETPHSFSRESTLRDSRH